MSGTVLSVLRVTPSNSNLYRTERPMRIKGITLFLGQAAFVIVFAGMAVSNMMLRHDLAAAQAHAQAKRPARFQVGDAVAGFTARDRLDQPGHVGDQHSRWILVLF